MPAEPESLISTSNIGEELCPERQGCGSQELSNILAGRIREAGGDVLLRTEVRRVLVDDEDRAYGVETDRGTFLGEAAARSAVILSSIMITAVMYPA